MTAFYYCFVSSSLLALVSLTATTIHTAAGDLVINEVAASGTSNACNGNGNDWLELYNAGPDDEDVTGYILHDDKGLSDPEAFAFPEGFILEADSYLVLCTAVAANATTDVVRLSPQFRIGSSDTLTLVRVDGSLVEIVSAVGPLPDMPNDQLDDVTFARDPDTGFFNYTASATPGEQNVMTELPTKEDVAAARKERLAQQNDDGIAFFNFDRMGLPVDDAMDTVLDLKVTMDAADYDIMLSNPEAQVYKDVQSVSVTSEDGTELLTLSSPGRIRTRGQEGVYMAACLGSPLPFRLDFDSTDETQTLFGTQKILLRSPIYDPSYMREWVYPRMLARWGLPHVRTRMVNFYINDVLQGAAYTLMEIPEDEYVFARNFPNYDPSNFALFQTTPLTQECGLYSQEQLSTANSRIDESATPPYAFERGKENSAGVTKLGADSMDECQKAYDDYYNDVLMKDVVLAYVRNDEECAKMFLDEGLVDQELGSDNWNNEIEKFINEVMSFKRCDSDCANNNLAEEVDLENFLKMFAFYAVTLNVDSPMGNVNNHYLAQEESTEEKWKLVAFDFDKPGSSSCNEDVCDARLVSWSITRPTCESLESNSLVGPLLTNQTLHAQYMSYVREFLDDVYTNAEFIEQIQSHATAIESTVKESFGGGASFENELSPDAATWDSGTFPLLPTMKARAEEVQKQLDALDDGTFARGPQVGAATGNEPWETCADWELSEPDTSACVEGCKYDGCFMAGWAIESFCEEGTGICYHGTEDMNCLGIADGDMYAGMKARDGFPTACRVAAGVPVKTSACPTVAEVAVLGSGFSAAISYPKGTVACIFALVVSQCVWYFSF